MATIGNITVGLSVLTAKFQAGLALARADLKAFGASMGSAIDSARGLGTALAGGLAAAGVGLGLKAVVGTAIEAEDAMARLAKVSSFDPEGLKEFKGQLQGLSTELKGVAIEDVYKIATEGSKLGVASGDLLEYTRGIAKLSVALDDIPADVLTNQIGKINVVFKLGVQGAQQLGSAIDKVADSGVSSAADILDVTQRISGVAAAAKIGAPDAIALAGALLDTGTNAEAAGTALNKLLMKMTIPASQAAFADAMGISADKFAAKVKAGPTAALLEFLAVIKGKGAAGQITALQDVLGKKNVAQVAEIQKLAAVVGTAGTYAQQAAHEFETLDNINNSYAINSATTSAALEQVGNQFKVLGDDIGSFFLPPLKASLEWVNEGIRGLQSYSSMLRVVGDDFRRVLVDIEKAKSGDIAGVLGDLVFGKHSAASADQLLGKALGSAFSGGGGGGAPGQDDAKAAARRALIARQAANAAKAHAEGEEDDLGGKSGKAAKAAAARAASLLAAARSPLEKYKDELKEINKLLKDHVITQEQFARLKTKLDKDDNPFTAAGAAVGGIAAEAASNAHAETHERKLAGAMELGSQEARSTVLDYRLSQGGKGKDAMKGTEKNTADTAKGIAGMAGILSGISAKLGATVNNFGTLAPIPIG